jgi:hypothetical protein
MENVRANSAVPRTSADLPEILLAVAGRIKRNVARSNNQ